MPKKVRNAVNQTVATWGMFLNNTQNIPQIAQLHTKLLGSRTQISIEVQSYSETPVVCGLLEWHWFLSLQFWQEEVKNIKEYFKLLLSSRTMYFAAFKILNFEQQECQIIVEQQLSECQNNAQVLV
jgi:hypothetical protein